MLALPASLDRKNLESRLEHVLIPVEPNAKFVHKLQAKLVRVRGAGGFSPWMAVVVLATAVLILATWLSLTLRVILALLGLLGIAGKGLIRKKSPNRIEKPAA
jgi:hypothetical protein